MSTITRHLCRYNISTRKKVRKIMKEHCILYEFATC